MSGVIQVHGTFRIHDVMSCSGADICFIAFGAAMVNSKQYRGIYCWSCVSVHGRNIFKRLLEFEFCDIQGNVLHVCPAVCNNSLKD